MLIEGLKQNMSEISNSTHPSDDFVFFVRNKPVMQSAIDVLEKLGKNNKVVLSARSTLIPNAVAIANILTEKMLRGNCRIERIKVDSQTDKESGRMLSTIEIILLKTS